MVSSIGANVRQVIRACRRRPFNPAITVLLVTLGVGTPAALWGSLSLIVSPPAPGISAPEDVLWLSEPMGGFIPSTLLELRSAFATLGPSAAYGLDYSPTVGGSWRREARVAYVSADYFAVLRPDLEAGRGIGEVDSHYPVAVATDEWCRDAFGHPSQCLGRQVSVDGFGYTIIGVTAVTFRGIGYSPVSLFLPLRYSRSSHDGAASNSTDGMRCSVLIRIPPASLPQARSLAKDVLFRVEGRRDVDIQALRLREFRVVRNAETDLLTILATLSGVFFLSSVSSVVGLAVLRCRAREREAAVRLALGAGTWQVIRPTVIESILLSALGGLLAGCVALPVSGLLRPLVGAHLVSGGHEMALRIGLLSLCLATVTLLLSASVPLLWLPRRAIANVLRNPGPDDGHLWWNARLCVGVGQIGLAFVVLIDAALLIQGVLKWRAVDFGFDTEKTVLGVVDWRSAGYGVADSLRLTTEVATNQRADGAQRQVAYAFGALFDPTHTVVVAPVYLPNGRLAGAKPDGSISMGPANATLPIYVSPNYLSEMGVRVLAGRAFSQSDLRAAVPRVVLSRKMAEFVWPAEPVAAAVGRCIVVGNDDVCSEVIGVASDVAYNYSAQTPYRQNIFYLLPSVPEDRRFARVTTKTTFILGGPGSADALGAAARRLTRSVPGLLPESVRVEPALASLLGRRITPWEYTAVGGVYFAVLTCLLAVVGLVGILTEYVVSERRAIAIRLALGAPRVRVIASVFGRSIALAGGGALIGVLLAAITSAVLAGFDVKLGEKALPWSALVSVGAATACLASVIPTYRIFRMKIIDILRD